MVANQTNRVLIPLSDAAKYTGVSTKTIRRRISDGTITGYRAGPRLIRVDLNEVEGALLQPMPSVRSIAGARSAGGAR